MDSCLRHSLKLDTSRIQAVLSMPTCPKRQENSYDLRYPSTPLFYSMLAVPASIIQALHGLVQIWPSFLLSRLTNLGNLPLFHKHSSIIRLVVSAEFAFGLCAFRRLFLLLVFHSISFSNLMKLILASLDVLFANEPCFLEVLRVQDFCSGFEVELGV